MGRTQNEEGYGGVNRFFTKPVVVAIIAPIITAIISGIVVSTVTKDKAYESAYEAVQKATVEMLANKLDYIDANEQLDDAVGEIVKKEEEAKKASDVSSSTVKQKDQEIDALNKQLEEAEKQVQISTPLVERNGEKLEDTGDSLLQYKDEIYISEPLLSRIMNAEDENGYIHNERGLFFNFSREGIRDSFDDMGLGIFLTSLDDAKKTAEHYVGYSGLSDNSGKSFEKCIYPKYSGDCYVEYKVDKKYQLFTCEFFVPSEASKVNEDNWKTASISVTGQKGDEKGIDMTGYTVSKREAPNKISESVFVGEFDYIRIDFSNAESQDIPLIAVGNPKVYSAP